MKTILNEIEEDTIEKEGVEHMSLSPKYDDFKMDCAMELVDDYAETMTIDEALKVINAFGDFDFWRNYLKLKTFIREGMV